jgi:hypothetical protein
MELLDIQAATAIVVAVRHLVSAAAVGAEQQLHWDCFTGLEDTACRRKLYAKRGRRVLLAAREGRPHEADE